MNKINVAIQLLGARRPDLGRDLGRNFEVLRYQIEHLENEVQWRKCLSDEVAQVFAWACRVNDYETQQRLVQRCRSLCDVYRGYSEEAGWFCAVVDDLLAAYEAEWPGGVGEVEP